MTPEYLSSEDAAVFCGAPNAKAFRERMYRAGFRAGKWGMWRVDVLRALMNKPRRRNRGFQSRASHFQQGQCPRHSPHVASDPIRDVHAAQDAKADTGSQRNSIVAGTR